MALAARGLHSLLPPPGRGLVGEVVLAVLLGLVLANAVRLPGGTEPGIRFSLHKVLRAAIVLLGAGLSFRHVVAIGGRALGFVVLVMALGLCSAHLLGRLAGVPGRLATLIGVGTAVCGNSAIVASAPVIGARDEEVAFAVATNTLFGTLAVFLYPLIGHGLDLSADAFGTWTGLAVNDTSQVVAVAFAFGDGAGRVATVVKLTRNALMGVVILGLGLAYSAESERRGTGHSRLLQSVPPFVLGFLALAALNTAGAIAWASRVTGLDVAGGLHALARVLILVALAGVGLGTRLDAMRRIGPRPFLVGLAAALTTSLASYALIRWLGPAAEP